jgi:hypothetical protein
MGLTALPLWGLPAASTAPIAAIAATAAEEEEEEEEELTPCRSR